MFVLACESRNKGELLPEASYALLGRMFIDCVSRGGFGEFVRAMKKCKGSKGMTDQERVVWETFMRLWPENGPRPRNAMVMCALEKSLPQNRVPTYDTMCDIIERLHLREYPRRTCAESEMIACLKHLVGL